MDINYYDSFPGYAQLLLHMRKRLASGKLTDTQAAWLKKYMESEYIRKVMEFSHFQWYWVDDMDPNGPQSFRVFIDKTIEAILSDERAAEG